MKVVFILEQINVGGVETSIFNMILNLQNHGVECFLCLYNASKNTIRVPNFINQVNVFCDIPNFTSIKGKRVFENLKKIGVAKFLKYYLFRLMAFVKNDYYGVAFKHLYKIQNNKFDVCCVIKENEPSIYFALKKIVCKKIICFFHTACSYSKEYAKIYESSMVRSIVTVSHGNAKFLTTKMPSIANKIFVIHNFVDVNKIQTMSKIPLNYKSKPDFLLCTIGRVCKEKGIELIFNVSKKMVESHFSFKWIVIGPGDKGENINNYIERAKQYRLSKYLFFYDFCDNPYRYIAHSDLVVCPSIIESFGYSIRESQILGIPVLSTRTYGGCELINEGKTGFLCDINSESLLQCLKNIYNNRLLLKNIKDNLKIINFDENNIICRQLLEVFNN